MTDENQRDFTRITSAHTVVLTADDGTTVTGTLRDLSATGLFVVSDQRLAEGAECNITVALTEDTEGIGVRAQGSVLRSDENGMAIRIDAVVGENSFEHLRRLVLYNSPELDRTQNEFEDHIGLKPQE